MNREKQMLPGGSGKEQRESGCIDGDGALHRTGGRV